MSNPNKDKPCVIIAACPLSEAMRAYIPPHAFVIAADAGWQQAAKIGVEVDLVLGDFDSSPFPGGAVNTLVLPQEKNDTDTHFAAKEAVRRGFGSVTILGGMGGRVDHFFANLCTLLYLAEQGLGSRMVDEKTEIHCITPGEYLFNAKEDAYLSVFAAGGKAGGVCLQGVKYPLLQAELLPDFPLGVSNEFAAPQAEVSFATGHLFVMITQKDR